MLRVHHEQLSQKLVTISGLGKPIEHSECLTRRLETETGLCFNRTFPRNSQLCFCVHHQSGADATNEVGQNQKPTSSCQQQRDIRPAHFHKKFGKS